MILRPSPAISSLRGWQIIVAFVLAPLFMTVALFLIAIGAQDQNRMLELKPRPTIVMIAHSE
jgi:hypothetical protein